MKYPHVLASFYGTPWAITPEKLAEIQAFLERKAFTPAGAWGDAGPETVAAGRQHVAAHGPVLTAAQRNGVRMAGRVAVVPVHGTITQRAGLVADFSGGVSTEALGQQLDQLARDPGVKAIVLAVDSPGGSVSGVPELAAKIRGLRAEKKIVAVADSTAASAAYWLASQASEVYVTPGGMAGSVGVIVAHVDQSKLEEVMGVKTTLVTAGKYKGELDPSVPLSEDARANLQALADEFYGMFVNDVAKGRGVAPAKVKADFGQGRMLTAQDAKAAGMADGVRALEEVLAKLGGNAAPAAAAARVSAYDVACRLAELAE
jgi:signal peptide peptidase SppA